MHPSDLFGVRILDLRENPDAHTIDSYYVATGNEDSFRVTPYIVLENASDRKVRVKYLGDKSARIYVRMSALYEPPATVLSRLRTDVLTDSLQVTAGEYFYVDCINTYNAREGFCVFAEVDGRHIPVVTILSGEAAREAALGIYDRVRYPTYDPSAIPMDGSYVVDKDYLPEVVHAGSKLTPRTNVNDLTGEVAGQPILDKHREKIYVPMADGTYAIVTDFATLPSYVIYSPHHSSLVYVVGTKLVLKSGEELYDIGGSDPVVGVNVNYMTTTQRVRIAIATRTKTAVLDYVDTDYNVPVIDERPAADPENHPIVAPSLGSSHFPTYNSPFYRNIKISKDPWAYYSNNNLVESNVTDSAFSNIKIDSNYDYDRQVPLCIFNGMSGAGKYGDGLLYSYHPILSENSCTFGVRKWSTYKQSSKPYALLKCEDEDLGMKNIPDSFASIGILDYAEEEVPNNETWASLHPNVSKYLTPKFEYLYDGLNAPLQFEDEADTLTLTVHVTPENFRKGARFDYAYSSEPQSPSQPSVPSAGQGYVRFYKLNGNDGDFVPLNSYKMYLTHAPQDIDFTFDKAASVDVDTRHYFMVDTGLWTNVQRIDYQFAVTEPDAQFVETKASRVSRFYKSNVLTMEPVTDGVSIDVSIPAGTRVYFNGVLYEGADNTDADFVLLEPLVTSITNQDTVQLEALSPHGYGFSKSFPCSFNETRTTWILQTPSLDGAIWTAHPFSGFPFLLWDSSNEHHEAHLALTPRAKLFESASVTANRPSASAVKTDSVVANKNNAASKVSSASATAPKREASYEAKAYQTIERPIVAVPSSGNRHVSLRENVKRAEWTRTGDFSWPRPLIVYTWNGKEIRFVPEWTNVHAGEFYTRKMNDWVSYWEENYLAVRLVAIMPATFFTKDYTSWHPHYQAQAGKGYYDWHSLFVFNERRPFYEYTIPWSKDVGGEFHLYHRQYVVQAYPDPYTFDPFWICDPKPLPYVFDKDFVTYEHSVIHFSSQPFNVEPTEARSSVNAKAVFNDTTFYDTSLLQSQVTDTDSYLLPLSTMAYTQYESYLPEMISRNILAPIAKHESLADQLPGYFPTEDDAIQNAMDHGYDPTMHTIIVFEHYPDAWAWSIRPERRGLCGMGVVHGYVRGG